MEAGAKAANKPMVELKPFLQHMVGVFGADHLCWGSDYGNVEVDDMAYVKRAIAAADGLSAKEKSAFWPRSIDNVATWGYIGSDEECGRAGAQESSERVSPGRSCW